MFFVFKQKTVYEVRISDWSSDVCSSDLPRFCLYLWGRCWESPGEFRSKMTGTGSEVVAARKIEAKAWFERLRDDICAAFVALEDALAGVNAERFAAVPPGRFERKDWQRAAGGGGVMALNRARVFEQAGVTGSPVHGHFSPEFATQVPRPAGDPPPWATT